ncbi:MAG: GDP-mannose 4,6-dehydratase [Anaerolineae bacterium]
MAPRALITGIGGFAGSHLAMYLLQHTDLEVWGIDLVEGRTGQLRTEMHGTVQNRLTLRIGEILLDLPKLKALFVEAKPDYVFHLAAQAFVPASWADPWSTLENNIRGQLNVLLAAIALGTSPRVLVVGSADEYGLVKPEELPIRESNPLRPNSPYAVSKVSQDMLGYQYFVSHGLPVVRVRPFNHLGPGQSPAFVTSDFAKQIAEAEMGLREPVVRVGNLEARRDFSDVRDIVRGYYLALSKGEPGEVYNLGAERSYAIGEVLNHLVALSKVPLTIEVEPTRLRPSDIPEIIADCTKFRARTGWRAEIPLERSLKDILDYWRNNVSKNSTH